MVAGHRPRKPTVCESLVQRTLFGEEAAGVLLALGSQMLWLLQVTPYHELYTPCHSYWVPPGVPVRNDVEFVGISKAKLALWWMLGASMSDKVICGEHFSELIMEIIRKINFKTWLFPSLQFYVPSSHSLPCSLLQTGRDPFISSPQTDVAEIWLIWCNVYQHQGSWRIRILMPCTESYEQSMGSACLACCHVLDMQHRVDTHTSAELRAMLYVCISMPHTLTAT